MGVVQQGFELCAACGHIGEGQSLAKPAASSQVTVAERIKFEESRFTLCRVKAHPYRNLAARQISRLGGPDGFDALAAFESLQFPLDGCGAYRQEQTTHIFAELKISNQKINDPPD